MLSPEKSQFVALFIRHQHSTIIQSVRYCYGISVSDEVLVWLAVWSEVQMIRIWSS